MITKKIRFFMEDNDTPYTFKDEGLPYGPKWNCSRIAKRLSRKIYFNF